MRRCIVAGGVEPLLAEKILRIYIGIGGVQPLVVEKLTICFRSGVRQRWYLIVSRFLWINRWFYLGESVSHWSRYGLKQGNSLQIFKITHNHQIFYFIIIFWFIFSSFQVPQSWSLIHPKLLAIEADTARNSRISCKILKSLTTT